MKCKICGLELKENVCIDCNVSYCTNPYCDDSGVLVTEGHWGPEPEQCEFCYVMENSYYWYTVKKSYGKVTENIR